MGKMEQAVTARLIIVITIKMKVNMCEWRKVQKLTYSTPSWSVFNILHEKVMLGC